MFDVFDKPACQTVRRRIEKALSDIAADMGLDVSVSAGSFNDLNYKTRVEFSLKSTDGKTKEQIDFERYAPMYGLSPKDFGKTIKSMDRDFKIVEIKPKRSKYPVVLESVRTGRRYKMDADMVKSALASGGGK